MSEIWLLTCCTDDVIWSEIMYSSEREVEPRSHPYPWPYQGPAHIPP